MSDEDTVGDYWNAVKESRRNYRLAHGIPNSRKRYYAVAEGRNPGIYSSWDQASKEVNGYSGAKHRGFRSYNEAMHTCKPLAKLLNSNKIADAFGGFLQSDVIKLT